MWGTLCLLEVEVTCATRQGAGIDEPLASVTGVGTAFFEADGLGSITSLSGASGVTDTYTYKPFGITTATGSNPNRFRFTGREWDQETGLYYYRARYYDAFVGRFINEDPARVGVNFNGYVHNNPLNARDPSGLWDSYTHHALIWNALYPCGVDPSVIWALQVVSDVFDEQTGLWPWDAPKHGMAAPGQDPAEALLETETFVSDQLGNAQSAYGNGGWWYQPFGQAIHTMMDTTSPAHRKDGMPLTWPELPNALFHGDVPFLSQETWAHMTPELMQLNITNIQNAYEQVTGEALPCDCKQ